jgi:HEAT repeat protein
MKRFAVVLLLVLISVGAAAQDSEQLETFMDAFESGSPDVKLQVLRRAQEQPAEEMSPLYFEAAEYLENNAGEIENSAAMREMTQITAVGVREAGNVRALEALRRVFESYREQEMRVSILRTLGAVGGEHDDTITWLREWLSTQNDLQVGGARPNTRVIRAAVDAMAEISHPSFFEALLEAVLAQYSAGISDAARAAMYDLEGDLVQLAAQSIGNRGPEEKLQALEFLMAEEELTDEQKSAIAAAAMRDALATETRSRATEDTLREVRFLATEVLSENRYGEATDAMIGHFDETFLEFDRGQVTRSRVLDAIVGLGSMGTEAAAARLAEFLELLNNYTENDRPYDSRIVMATIRNLERLGYPVAYNSLFYASILEAYPARVQNAAEEAMATIEQ